MSRSDIEPGEVPDGADWQDALQKGLGRALRWAKNGKGRDETILLNACLTDLRYDKQCEDARGSWLWQIMEASAVVDRFREPILKSLQSVDYEVNAQQLCQFCVFYAMNGDDRFRHRLQEIVAEKPLPDCPWLGEEELIELDAEAGFLFVARARGERLLNREWDLDDMAMMDSAIEQLGESKAVELLAREAEASPEVRCFLERWRTYAETTVREPRQAHADRMRRITLSEIVRTAENAQKGAGHFRGWGMYARQDDLKAVLDRLFNSHAPGVIINYLHVFSNRPLPQFDERLLGLLEHEDERVRRRAYSTVAQNAHSSIRKFALDHLQTPAGEPKSLALLIRNFRPGDEDILLANLRIPDDPVERHWFLMDLLEILEQNPAARPGALALQSFRWTPCGTCRYRAAKLLIARSVAPKWLTDECQYDSVVDTRQLVKIGS
ncbi:MAG TPA: hypothetical protein VGY55_04370 [Pirellulales bacterium]|nr:hypothetical protein [Pirellulales bacterium]